MKRVASVVAVLLVAVVAVIGPAAAVQATPVKSRFELTVDKHVLYGGQRFTATGTSTVVCTWALAWNGETRSARDVKRLVATFTAPRVTRVTKIPLRGTCYYPPPSRQHARAEAVTAGKGATAAQTILVTVPPSWRKTIMITVLPPGNAVSPPETGDPGGPGGAGDLPNTGGPMLWLLMVGVGCALSGTVAVRSSRARGRAGEQA